MTPNPQPRSEPSHQTSPLPVTSKDPKVFPANGNFDAEFVGAGAQSHHHTMESSSSSAPPPPQHHNQNQQHQPINTFDGQNVAGGSSWGGYEDLSVSYRGASVEPFPAEVNKVLMEEIPPQDIEIKPG
jgi:hypothetical protein